MDRPRSCSEETVRTDFEERNEYEAYLKTHKRGRGRRPTDVGFEESPKHTNLILNINFNYNF